MSDIADIENEIRNKIEKIVEVDPRYSVEAYSFMIEAVEQIISELPLPRHVSARELLEGIKKIAWERFGPMAKEVFNFWGVKTTGDFGYIVYNLIDYELLRKSEEDRLEDFFDVYDFEETFENGYFKERST